MMTVLERLRAIEPAWAGIGAIAAAIAVLLALRALVAPAERGHVRAPLGFLLAALVLRLAAGRAGAMGLGDAASVLGFAGVLCVVVGLTGLATVLVFDVVLRHRQAPSVVRDLVQTVAVAAALLILLYQRGFDPFSLVTTSAVFGAIVGFALQNTIANVFAGLALPVERTLAIGDWIQVGTHTGRIREIKWRATSLVTKDGDTVIVPNNQLITADVKNISRPTREHRLWLRVGFHYRHPPNDVRRALLDAVRGAPGVLADPPPDAFPVELADSAVVYALRYWIDDFARSEPIEGEVRTRVWYAAQRAGLEIPFPIRTIVHAEAIADDTEARRRAALARVELLAPLDDACRTQLASSAREQTYAAGEDIIRQNEPGDSLFVIAHGEVDVRVSLDGVHRSIATLGSGQFFGEMSLMMNERRQATVTAITDTVCYIVDQTAMRCVFETRPSVAEDISALLADRQTALEASRDGLSAEARARRARETRSRLLVSIRNVFGI